MDQPELIARIDAIAKDQTGKPADSRTLIYRLVATSPSDDPTVVLAAFRDDRERELGPRKTLRGRVTDASGRPIAGAVISAYSGMLAPHRRQGELSPGLSQDRRGRHPAGLRRGPRLRVDRQRLQVDELGDDETVDFRLPRETPFRGRVMKPAGKPIAGAELGLVVPPETVVREVPENGRRLPMLTTLVARTDDRGEYTFAGVSAEVEDVAMAAAAPVSHRTHQSRQRSTVMQSNSAPAGRSRWSPATC